MRFFGIMLALGSTGCFMNSPPDGAEVVAEDAAVSQQSVDPVVASPDRTAALAKADLADGVEDKVAHKCAGCALAMDGDPAHVIEVDGYSLNMCAGECKTHFEEDLDGNLGQLIQ